MKTIFVSILLIMWAPFALASAEVSEIAQAQTTKLLETSNTHLLDTNIENTASNTSRLTAPHPAAVAYGEALRLLNSDPDAARKKAEEALELLGEDAPAADKMEVRTLIAIAGQLADPKNRRRAAELEDVLKERAQAGLRETSLSARGWLALCGFAMRREDWTKLAQYGEQAERVIETIAPNAIDPRAVAITYRGIARLRRHDPAITGNSKSRREAALVARAEESIIIFEQGISLYPVQESWETFNKTLATLIAWHVAVGGYYKNINPEAAETFLSAPERVGYRIPVKDIDYEKCDIEPVSRPAPRYPRDAVREAAVGAVIIIFDLTEDGRTENVRPFAAVPDSGFSATAIKAIQKWRYKIGDGTPALCRKDLRVQFDFMLE